MTEQNETIGLLVFVPEGTDPERVKAAGATYRVMAHTEYGVRQVGYTRVIPCDDFDEARELHDALTSTRRQEVVSRRVYRGPDFEASTPWELFANEDPGQTNSPSVEMSVGETPEEGPAGCLYRVVPRGGVAGNWPWPRYYAVAVDSAQVFDFYGQMESWTDGFDVILTPPANEITLSQPNGPILERVLRQSRDLMSRARGIELRRPGSRIEVRVMDHGDPLVSYRYGELRWLPDPPDGLDAGMSYVLVREAES